MNPVQYTSGRGYTNVSFFQAVDVFKEEGAVNYGIFYLPNKCSGHRHAHSVHFFNIYGREIGMYHPTLEALQIFDKPRTWASNLLQSLKFEPMMRH